MTENNDNVELSIRNVPSVLGVLLSDINTYDIINSEVLILTESAAKIFSEVVMYLEEVTPKDKRIADLYFLWAFAEYFGENREKAISLFSKSTRLKPELKKMANYNIAAIYEELGQIKDSEIYFKKQ